MSNKVNNEEYIEWDSFNVTQAEANRLRSEDSALSEDEAFIRACEDSFLQEDSYNNFLNKLDEELSKRKFKSDKWKATVEGFGWRNLSGEKEFHADNARSFLREILPNTDCSFKIYIGDPKKLRLQNWHHDSPTGNEWYCINPIR